jgi:fatty-acyl-CoA synthase
VTAADVGLALDISRRAHWNNHLERHAAALPQHAALRFEGTTTTWSQLRARVHALADALARRGIGFRDRVAVVMGNRPEFIEAVLAANLLGAIAVPLNFRLTGSEAAYILNDSGARIVLADELGVPIVTAAAPGLTGKLAAITTQTPGDLGGSRGRQAFEFYGDLLSEGGEPHRRVDVPEESAALIMYTSGTTGRPKGAVLSHLNLQTQALSIIRAFQLGGEEEVSLVATPLFHIGGIGSVIPTILVGGTVAIMAPRAFSSPGLLDLLEDEAVTTVFLVPTQWQAVCEDPTVRGRDLSRLRVTAWGGAPAPDALLRRMGMVFSGALNVALFGQTEMTPVTCVLAGPDALRKLGSVGKPIPTVTARVVDDDMKDVAPGQVGEIVYRGSGLMLGYWNNPEATEESFRGGWFHSGDLVRADEEGYIYVVDRVKDMIISGGENIYCAEVENVLAWHPNVTEVSVVGAPHPTWGETPVAFVVLRDADAGLDLDDLRVWAAGSIARYKLPTRLRLIAALPRNASGKVLKDVLRNQAVDA